MQTEYGTNGSALLREEYGHFINGEWVTGSTGRTIVQSNPATGAPLAKIQAGSPQDVHHAVTAAAAAFPHWSRSTPQERQELLLEMARRIRIRAADFARIESLNNGKTITEASVFDVPQAIAQFELFAGAAYGLHGELQDHPDAIAMVHREAIGVCAQIIPWNVPLLMAAMKLAPALAAGNTVVLKPAETVCLSVLEFVREIADIVPPGVINVVTGFGSEVGEPLVTHPLVRKVAFTGSVATARRVIGYAAQNVIPQTMELGGKSAHIVCPGADLEAAAESAVLSTVFNKGEVCLAGSRLFVHSAVKDEFLSHVLGIMKTLRIGDPLDPTTQLGAMASKDQFNKVAGYLDLARQEGAVALIGGEAARGGTLDNGLFISPTIFDNVSNDMRIAREEIFGPVTCVLNWSDESDLLRQVNDSPFGLAGGIWTRDLAQAHRIARGMETGTVWINRYFNLPVGVPLGGYKQSGFGREFARSALDHYTLTKSVIVNLKEGKLGIFG